MTGRFWRFYAFRAPTEKITKVRSTRKHLLSMGRITVLLLVSIALLMLISGMRIPLDLFMPSGTSALETKLVTAPTKKVPVCPKPLTDSTAFARCPSFWVDFSQQRDGKINQKQFNIVTDQLITNHEAQLYTNNASNVRIWDGNLVIRGLNEPKQGYQYTSARIDTHGKEDFLYGKIVVRAMLPVSIGTWPAIWLLPSDSKYADMGMAAEQAQGLNDGEIDIAEAIGSYPHLIYGITHTALYHQDGVNHTYFNTVTVPDSDIAFHDYGVEWTPTSITISMDGVPYHTYAKQPNATYQQWPFDQPFYLVINLALGGSWAGRDKRFAPDGIDKSALPAMLKVRSINYYRYNGPM